MSTARWKVRPQGSNWGEFGPDDQIGRMNLLTPQLRLNAMQEVTEGISFCLSLPLDYPGGSQLFQYRAEPQFSYQKRGDGHNFNFPLRSVCSCFTDLISDESVRMHTQYSTHWDALGHFGQFYDVMGEGSEERVYYNGFRAGRDIIGPDDAESGLGAHALGIERLATAGAQGRGVLIDLEAIYGRERALVGYDELAAAIEKQEIVVGTGDFLCIYTGFSDLLLEMRKRPDRQVLDRSCAVLNGRDGRLLDWITATGVVAICADNFAVEAYPAPPGAGQTYSGLPLHEHCLFKLGVHLGELWYFAELAAWLRENRRSSFLLTAPPLRLPGAVGSPLSPIATV